MDTFIYKKFHEKNFYSCNKPIRIPHNITIFDASLQVMFLYAFKIQFLTIHCRGGNSCRNCFRKFRKYRIVKVKFLSGVCTVSETVLASVSQRGAVIAGPLHFTTTIDRKYIRIHIYICIQIHMYLKRTADWHFKFFSPFDIQLPARRVYNAKVYFHLYSCLCPICANA